MGVEYDIVPTAVRRTIEQVDSLAGSVQSHGNRAVAEGQSVAGLCGTAVVVADAFSRLWAQRNDTGVRGGQHAAGCSSAVSQACAAISEGDELMAQASSTSGEQAARTARFGQQRM